MSANNYGICPQCHLNREVKLKSFRKKAMAAYSNVTVADYQRVRRAMGIAKKLDCTLREDWEILITETGEFCVSYYAHCDKCGFEFQFKKEEKVPLKAAKDGDE